MLFPPYSSRLRRTLLAPAAALYGAGSYLHRTLWLRPRLRNHGHLAPLVVIGSLRAGGAGKTPVARELARHLGAQGLRVGVLAYAIRFRETAAQITFTEIFPDSDWRDSSDEAVLLARGLPQARVFVTRDREATWEALSRTGGFDVLVSDDGLMDPRLHGSFRTMLVRPGERPVWRDLLPAGPYRLTAAALGAMDQVLCEGTGFVRAPRAPTGWTAEKTGWIVGGLGNPDHFLKAVKSAGMHIAGSTFGPDHGLPDLADLAKARRAGARAGVTEFWCSEKDAIKLENHPEKPENLLVVGEDVTLSPEFLTAVRAFLARATS